MAYRTVEERLFEEGYAFDFFQAVRLLERLEPARRLVGQEGPPRDEVVRFSAHLSLAYPSSRGIYEIEKASPQLLPSGQRGPARMVVTFMGLTGPKGILPQHYTELLMRLEREAKGPEKRALRAWLDLFNHRLISLFYRAWEKYRFYIPYERGQAFQAEPDLFTECLFNLVGLPTAGLRNRLRVHTWEDVEGERRQKVLARIDDLALLHYSGFLAHRPRCALSLEAMLCDFFELAVEVQQFRSQWLRLEPANQSRLEENGNTCLGLNVVAGERVQDAQSRFRLRVGPMNYARFTEFLPSRAPTASRKAFFLLVHLTRLYVGPELDFEVQLVLKKEDVPECRLGLGAEGPQLGWNTWVRSRDFPRDADDPVFEAEEVVRLEPEMPRF
jgi:type VI secretion system protein ImpH